MLAIAQTLHTALRKRRPDPKEKSPNADLDILANFLVQDIQSDRLPPNHAAHLHLLAFYKEAKQLDKAFNFWKWLENQDDSYVSPAVYGVAIELLAIQGRPAEETENLYVQALKRFPGSFNEYHLSPDAVLPDRSQPINIKGIPMTLLQGIVTARLLRGDSKNAYLALDTALRLFPTQIPSRFFTLFIEERPVTEAYNIFMLACRSGTTIGPDVLKALLTKLRQVAVVNPLANAPVLRSTLTASYAYAASGASLTSNHLTELVIAVTAILQHATISTLPRTEVNQLAEHILLIVSRLFKIWAGQDSRPGIAAFHSIISNVAGRGQRQDVITTCLEDMNELGLEPNPVTRRSILKAAGDIGHVETMKSAWTDIIAARHQARAVPDLADWTTLAKAARQLGEQDFVREKLQDAATVNPHLASRIDGLLHEPLKKTAAEAQPGSAEPIRHLIGNILQDTVYMEDQLENSRFRDFHTNPLPMSLVASKLMQSAPEGQLREIYDELTTDISFAQINSADAEDPALENDQIPDTETPSSETLPETSPESPSLEALISASDFEAPPAVSSTGFGYADLRYENWKTINELLAEAEKHDSDYLASIDAAIQKGTLPPKRSNGWKTPDTISPSTGLSNLSLPESVLVTEEGNTSRDHDNSSIRENILRLRGRLE